MLADAVVVVLLGVVEVEVEAVLFREGWIAEVGTRYSDATIRLELMLVMELVGCSCGVLRGLNDGVGLVGREAVG